MVYVSIYILILIFLYKIIFVNFSYLGDNSDKLCQICIGRIPGDRCTPADPYAGFEGAFRCLIEAGEIAFLKHTTIHEMLDNDVHFGNYLYIYIQKKISFLIFVEMFSFHPFTFTFCFYVCLFGLLRIHALSCLLRFWWSCR